MKRVLALILAHKHAAIYTAIAIAALIAWSIIRHSIADSAIWKERTRLALIAKDSAITAAQRATHLVDSTRRLADSAIGASRRADSVALDSQRRARIVHIERDSIFLTVPDTATMVPRRLITLADREISLLRLTIDSLTARAVHLEAANALLAAGQDSLRRALTQSVQVTRTLGVQLRKASPPCRFCPSRTISLIAGVALGVGIVTVAK
jgi:hypothetical protein